MERTRTRGLVVVEWSRPSIDLVREPFVGFRPGAKTRPAFEDVTIPFKIMTGVDTVAIGERHVLILKRSGELYATGSGEYGALGTGSSSDVSVPTLVAEDVEWISAGAVVSFFRNKRLGQLRVMGTNRLGPTSFFPEYSQSVMDTPTSMSW